MDHSPGAMRMDRANQGIPILFNHDRDTHLGVLEECRCGDDKKGRGVARFSRSALAEEKWKDVSDGILKDVSVGYAVHYLKEIPTKELLPDLAVMAAREKLPVYRITDWGPFEASMVTVPADPTVGVGRSGESVPEGCSGQDGDNRTVEADAGDGKSEITSHQFLETGLALIGAVAGRFIYQFFFFNATGEEIGWRGFALPRLQAFASPLIAILVLNFFWGPWHFFLWQAEGGRPIFSLAFWAKTYLELLPGTSLISWFYIRSKGSILVAGIVHAAANTTFAFFPNLDWTVFNCTVAVAALVMILKDQMWKKLPPGHPAVYSKPVQEEEYQTTTPSSHSCLTIRTTNFPDDEGIERQGNSQDKS